MCLYDIVLLIYSYFNYKVILFYLGNNLRFASIEKIFHLLHVDHLVVRLC